MTRLNKKGKSLVWHYETRTLQRCLWVLFFWYHSITGHFSPGRVPSRKLYFIWEWLSIVDCFWVRNKEHVSPFLFSSWTPSCADLCRPHASYFSLSEFLCASIILNQRVLFPWYPLFPLAYNTLSTFSSWGFLSSQGRDLVETFHYVWRFYGHSLFIVSGCESLNSPLLQEEASPMIAEQGTNL